MTDAHECGWYNTKWTDGWETDPSLIRDWEFCDNPNHDLQKIHLRKNNLQGQVPLELSLLSNSLGKFTLDCIREIRIYVPTLFCACLLALLDSPSRS